MNNIIKAIFNNFTVDGVLIPVKFLRYEGHGQPYVIYSLESNGEPLRAEDNIANYVEYYDFTIYSKGNYLKIEERLKDLLIENGFRWEVDRSSGDLYEPVTGYYFKTLNFSYLRGGY